MKYLPSIVGTKLLPTTYRVCSSKVLVRGLIGFLHNSRKSCGDKIIQFDKRRHGAHKRRGLVAKASRLDWLRLWRERSLYVMRTAAWQGIRSRIDNNERVSRWGCWCRVLEAQKCIGRVNLFLSVFLRENTMKVFFSQKFRKINNIN